MRPSITWYDILGALPDASAGEIQHAYDAKADLLRPQLLSGAPSKVITAATRAQGIIDAARRVLADPVSRQRYDEAAGTTQRSPDCRIPISPPITRAQTC
jgi:curved DNA-binding protein CbpA